MRQVWITRHGPPEVLQVRDAPDPNTKPGCVRIRVAFSGINFADIMARMGQYPDAPRVPCVVGYEVSGTIDAIGEGVNGFAPADRVVAMTHFSGYSDIVVVPAGQVFPLPNSYPLEKAAAIPVNYLTAWLMLVRMGNVKPGERALIHSIGGGVGQAALQICKWKGAEVIGTASAGKHDRLRQLGVQHCIDYTRADVRSEVRRITHGNGVDIVLDPIGGRSFRQGFQMLAPMGRLCMFGAFSTAPALRRRPLALAKGLLAMPWFHPIPLINQNKVVMGVNLGHLWMQMEKLRADFQEILTLCGAGTFDPAVDRVFPFEEAPAAHQYIQERRNFGKVLLRP